MIEMDFIRNNDPNEIYEILDPLGDGSYGYVYKAINKIKGENVAIKKIPVIESDIGTCLKEIEIIKQCKSEFIVSYKSAYFYDQYLWIIMEFCEAGSISDLIKSIKNPMKELEISCLLNSTLKGLDYLHKNKLIHRDIKAANILLDLKGKIKIADFGVSAQITSTIGFKNSFIGTPYWMSPEILKYNQHTNKTDIWSLGITTIEILTGEPPYAGIHPRLAMMNIIKKPTTCLPKNNNYSLELNDFVKKCLTINADERPSASELLNHPFIVKYKKIDNVLYKLITTNWDDIQNYRIEKSKRIKNGSISENSSKNKDSKENNNSLKMRVNESGTILEKVDNLDSIIYNNVNDLNNNDYKKFCKDYKQINKDYDIKNYQNEYIEIIKNINKLNYKKYETVEDDYSKYKEKMEKEILMIEKKYLPKLKLMKEVIDLKENLKNIEKNLISNDAEIPNVKIIKKENKKKNTKQIILNNKIINLNEKNNVTPKFKFNKKSPNHKKKKNIKL